jgi:VWFA-related protein
MIGAQARPQSGQETAQAIPDAPRPRTTLPNPDSITPGQGTTSSSNSDLPAATPPASATPPAAAVATGQTPTYEAPVGKGQDAITTLMVHVDAVDVAFTVKDSKGHLVPGLTSRDVQVYENGLLQHIDVFTNEALPMSVAIVIDQSMTRDQMQRVNDAMGALPDAFTQYDEASVIVYNKTPKEVTDFTGAQSPRLAQAIERSKGSGRDPVMAGSLGGPLAQNTIVNDQNFDPNTSANRNHSTTQINPPQEIHALNDAIFLAATKLSKREVGRRRVIYVISDGKDYGSKFHSKELIHYLQQNRIEVDGTLVGDSAVWGLGLIDRMHLPFQMRDNVLKAISDQTGGNLDSDFRTPAIEKSFSKIAMEARTRYTVGWTTHEPFLDGKYRKLEIKVLQPDLTVIAPPGYWPWAREVRQTTATPTAPRP